MEPILGIAPQPPSNGARHLVTLRERSVSFVHRRAPATRSLMAVKRLPVRIPTLDHQLASPMHLPRPTTPRAADDGAEAMLLRRAATELGAKVAQVRPFPDDAPAPAEIELTARLIGRLYDAADWPRAPAAVLQQVRSAAGIPIYDGLTAAIHPTARLAGLLGVETPIADRRRFVVQAVLLATII